MQKPYDIQFLETSQFWGSIHKIKDPFVFFNSLETSIWHPVTGVTEDTPLIYFEDLEVYFQILDTRQELIGFIRILFEESTISLHGSILRNPVVAYKAWYQIISSLFHHSEQMIIKSRVVLDNQKALSFLLNSGFQIAFIQNIGNLSVIHLNLKFTNFIESKITYLHTNKSLPSIQKNPLLNKSIKEVIGISPILIDKIKVKFYSEDTRVIYDQNLWLVCLFESHTHFHEITVYFIDEFEKINTYAPLKESYCYKLFKELSKILLNSIENPYLLKVSRTSYNLAPLYSKFKYLGSDYQFLFFNSNN